MQAASAYQTGGSRALCILSHCTVTVAFCHTSRKHWGLEKEGQTCFSLHPRPLSISPVLGLPSTSSNLCSRAQVGRRVSSLKLDWSDLRGMFVCCAQVAAESTAFLMNRMITQKDSSALPAPEWTSEIVLCFTGFRVSGQPAEAGDTVQQQEQGRIKEDLCFHYRDSPGAWEWQRMCEVGSSKSVHLPLQWCHVCQGNSCHGHITDGKYGRWLSFLPDGQIRRQKENWRIASQWQVSWTCSLQEEACIA